MGNQAAAGAGIRHVAWLYRGPGEFAAGVREFAATAEPVLVAVPAARLPAGLAGDDATVLDVEELGRNPARIMPSLRAFAEAHPGRGVRVLAELAWPGRSAAELGEVARYESMLEYAFAGHTITIMCPYNEAELADSVISAARVSHPRLLRDGREFDSGDYRSVLDGHGMAPPLLAPATARKL
ncbi:MAG: MEDS domain-containing protein, partial [Actinobacteria bacterium]|nr:MEDS domain-containing protein [Actinomycetota bacterium]